MREADRLTPTTEEGSTVSGAGRFGLGARRAALRSGVPETAWSRDAPRAVRDATEVAPSASLRQRGQASYEPGGRTLRMRAPSH
jgi:hypothetical protein